MHTATCLGAGSASACKQILFTSCQMSATGASIPAKIAEGPLAKRPDLIVEPNTTLQIQTQAVVEPCWNMAGDDSERIEIRSSRSDHRDQLDLRIHIVQLLLPPPGRRLPTGSNLTSNHCDSFNCGLQTHCSLPLCYVMHLCLSLRLTCSMGRSCDDTFHS